MSRTIRHQITYGCRSVEFHYCQKKISGERSRKFYGYDIWDAPKANRESSEAYRVVSKLLEKGWGEEEIIRHLRKKYNLSQIESRNFFPYDFRNVKGSWGMKRPI